MSFEEHKKARTYVLQNCAEVYPYIEEFDEVAPEQYSDEPISLLRDNHFAEWFENRVKIGLVDGSTRHLEIIAKKLSIDGQFHNGYFVNGYKFHTQNYGKGLGTSNCGVCVRGETYNNEESDYYGLVDEILELKYECNGSHTVVLFKCTWFDNKHCVVVHKNGLVDVKPKSRLPSDDPFILASQAEQVFYASYLAVTSDTKDVWAVVKTKSRHIYEVITSETEVLNDVNTETHVFFQISERFELPDEVTRCNIPSI